MAIVSGYQKMKDYIKQSSGYKLLSRWANANTIECDDAQTVQNKIGGITGISSSLTANSSTQAASTQLTNQLYQNITQVNSELGGLSFGQDAEGNWGYQPSGADAVIPFNGLHLEVLLQNTDNAVSETHYFPPGNYKLSFLSMCRTNIAYCPICKVYKDESIIYTADTQLYTWSGSGQEIGVRGGIYDISLPDGGNIYLELSLSGVRVIPYAVAALYKV